MEYLENKFFLLAVTFGVFFLSRIVQKKTGWVIFEPYIAYHCRAYSVF